MGVCGHLAYSLRTDRDQQGGPDRCSNTRRGLDRPPALDRRTTVNDIFPPPDRGRHGWAELLALVGDLRCLAYDRSLDDADRARRIRDRIDEYDGRFDD